jgi:D-sedoheptulose 7-phosphate isomerase
MNQRALIQESSRLLETFLISRAEVLERAVRACVEALRRGGKLLLFGNGGSAAEAQHFAAELVNKFYKKRPPIRAVALTTDTSVLTSIGNDVRFEAVFSRQIEALADAGDVALALSTSGGSPNVIRALRAARKRKLVTIGLTGEGGGKMAGLCDILLDVPSSRTPRVQEIHLISLHWMAEEIEKRLFS